MEELRVRSMQTAELDEVIDVWYRSLDASLASMPADKRGTEQQARAFFREVVAVRYRLFVAARAGRIVGVLALQGGDLDRLYVDAGAQGQGVGSALLAEAKRLSPRGLRLVTLQANSRARRFYERHGFESYEWGRSPLPEDEPDVWYRWPAKAADERQS